MEKDILGIYKSIQDISWYFGNQTFGNECCEGLSVVEYMVLKNVCEVNDITVQNLGIKLNITKSGISKIIDRLEDKKYVLRKKTPRDGRLCYVQPTDGGKNIIEKIFNEYSKYLTGALANLDENLIFDLKQNLEILYKAIEERGYIK